MASSAGGVRVPPCFPFRVHMVASRVLVSLLAGSLIGVLIFVDHARAQENDVCSKALVAAEDQYVNAEYEEARRTVSACLNQSEVPREQAVAAYRLLALINLKQDELERARSAIVNILGLDPNYEADPVESPPAYVSLVAIVRRDLETTRTAEGEADSTRTPFLKRRSTWIAMGSILVGSGVATVLALDSGGGGGGEDVPPGSLPLPPGTP